ncbi:hypothetical protein OH76DRAFT_491561 [Lentinus brumalis]|uniref:Uncharacterized protein n=1 Tax=Lentinus brumalis TaxID=2498619 RepID=A0A371DBM4_9APHY|nr:hypothetical protein OH76DRAFT_491561 [Polyporus brumalis]
MFPIVLMISPLRESASFNVVEVAPLFHGASCIRPTKAEDATEKKRDPSRRKGLFSLVTRACRGPPMSGGCRRLVGATLASSDLGRWLAPDCSRPCRELIRPGPAIKPSSRGLQAPLAASQPSCARKRGINERRTEQTAQHAEHPAHTYTHGTDNTPHTHDTDNTTRRAYMQATSIRINTSAGRRCQHLQRTRRRRRTTSRLTTSPGQPCTLSRPNGKLASTPVLNARARSSSSVFARRPQAAQLIRNQNAVNALKQRMPEPPSG